MTSSRWEWLFTGGLLCMNSSTYIVYCLPSRHADIIQTHIQIYLLTSSSFCSAIFKLSLIDLANFVHLLLIIVFNI